MRDATLPIRKAIYDKIKPVLTVPVYNGYIPANVSTIAYVTISSISNTDDSTMNSNDTETSIRISIYTKDNLANSGLQKDVIANTILQTLIPNPQATLQLDNLDFCGLKLTGDDSPDIFENGTNIFANRFLTFRVLSEHHAV